jgi:3-hydroxyisobutyrate dehydrogenase
MATIGFAGLGHMGTPMAGRLAAAGHRLRVFDIAAAARARLAGLDGVAVVSQVAEIADGADVVILMLPDSAVVAQVLLADGLLEHVASSAVVVDMSSSVPARTRELARTAAERGVTLIDAPVSGGVAGAQSGSLTIMAGGPADVLDRLRPVLQVLGSHVVHAGEFVGAGHAIKALNNLMSAAHLLASSEALLAGRQFGLDPDVMLNIVNSSSGRSGSTQVKWPKFILPQAYDSGFGLRLMLKDMRIALQLEQEVGVPAPLGQAAVAAWAAAAEDLPAAADHTEIARWLAAHIDQSRESERPLPIASSASIWRELADPTRASRTSIHEALRELAAEGLVTSVPGRRIHAFRERDSGWARWCGTTTFVTLTNLLPAGRARPRYGSSTAPSSSATR